MVPETAEERIMKTKIKITCLNPFFAYLSLYLTTEEDKLEIVPKNCGMSISPTGHLLYRKEFIDEITDPQLLGVLLHEILHVSLFHLIRCGRRNPLMWNISIDLIANTILLKNGYELPKGIKPNSKNQFIIFNKVIKDIDKKAAEDIYLELPEIPEEKSNIYRPFDEHGISQKNKKNGKMQPLTESELQELETEWINRTQIAMIMAQQRGKLPLGLERYINKLKNFEINYKVILRRFIQQSIPMDYNWMKPSKKSIACGCYLPNTLKDKIDVVIGVDTSSSIEKKELTKFLSEVIGIAKSFREAINMRIMFHDTKVQADYMVKNGNIPKIMAIKPKGGGGTSHKDLLNKITKEVRNCKCLISYTDGYSDIEDLDLNSYRFPKLFIINKEGTIPKIKKGEAIFIKLKND